MPATKALFWFALIGAGAAFLVFLVFPKYRPGFVKSAFRAASGHSPAATSTEAMERFHDCIRNRDYETAALYTGGEYKAYLEMAAEPANKLAGAIDDLLQNVNDVAHINSPDGKFVLGLLEPFPKNFKFDMKESKSGDEAIAVIAFDFGKPGDPKPNRTHFNVEDSILLSLVPIPWDGTVALKYEGNDKEKAWKIHFPVTPELRTKVDYLKQNYGNYVRALENIKYSIKHDAATKSDFENQLQKQLSDAK